MSTYPTLSRSLPITVADRFGRWWLARAAAHTDQVEQLLAEARRELAAATVLVNWAALPEDACGLPVPVCSACLGTALTRTGVGAVACPDCGHAGTTAQARYGYLCTRPGAVTIVETKNSEVVVCLSHAVALLRRVPRATVVQAERSEIEQLVRVLDRPLRIALRTARPRGGWRPEPGPAA